MTRKFHPEIALRNCMATARGNAAFESAISTGSALRGEIMMRTKWKLRTISRFLNGLRSSLGGIVSISRNGTPIWRIHPGEILREEFLKPIRMSAYALAKRLHIPAPPINDLVLERRGITAGTAVRLSRFFGASEQFWLNLQDAYEVNRVKSERAEEFKRIEPLKISAASL
jgi:antitoxin HigA-1